MCFAGGEQMDLAEPKVTTTPAKPGRRWHQFGLKTLFVLPVVVGLLLVLYLYWNDWRRHRPPYMNHDSNEYFVACDDFFDDLKAGRLDHAYDAASARFKKQMSRSEFETTIGRFLALQQIDDGVGGRHSGPTYSNQVLDRNWCCHSEAVSGPDKKVTELCVWVLTDVSDDSFFYRRPPPPRVEEMQILEFSQAEWESNTMPDLKPSWEKQPSP
jgi:hypothetical protein